MKLSCMMRLLILILFTSMPLGLQAQVQTGHYAPGWNGALKGGMMIPDPGFYMMNTNMFFNASRFVDGAGNTSYDQRTDYVLFAMALAYRPDLQLLGGDYQAVVTPAFGNLSGIPILVDGKPQNAPVGIADIFFTPLMLGWHWQNFHLIAAQGFFAPTGSYTAGSSENTGLGFWTFMPFSLATYRLQKGVFEKMALLVTAGLFYEIHGKQKGRDFRPGDSFTVEYSVGLELSPQTDLGLSGFYYTQVSDASGSDVMPAAKYRSFGLGGTFSRQIGAITLRLRVYQDFGVRNGPQGTLVYIDLAWGWPFKKH